ncbi:hypothetical protein [Bacillus coahuilensis]|uniref:hypothetical protein n=1 Tax=Bacillus coahuilensis TaxID=408580 RepID=UPI000185072A|nr:hypothetical protein [Bacillus coahuilensis]
MSTTEVSKWQVVMKQFHYKRKAYVSIFLTLIFVQILGMLFSFTSNGGGSGDSIGISYGYTLYSSSAIIMMTLLWAFISSLLLTTKAYKFDDFLFVTNRLTSNVSNVLFLLFMSLLGAITTSLASLVFRLLLFLLKDSESLVMMNMGIGDWIMGVVVAFLYILLVATIGYLIGTVFQWGDHWTNFGTCCCSFHLVFETRGRFPCCVDWKHLCRGASIFTILCKSFPNSWTTTYLVHYSH